MNVLIAPVEPIAGVDVFAIDVVVVAVPFDADNGGIEEFDDENARLPCGWSREKTDLSFERDMMQSVGDDKNVRKDRL